MIKKGMNKVAVQSATVKTEMALVTADFKP